MGNNNTYRGVFSWLAVLGMFTAQVGSTAAAAATTTIANNHQYGVDCRVTVNYVRVDGNINGDQRHRQEISCIPIVARNNQYWETDDVFQLDLPDDIRQKHQQHVLHKPSSSSDDQPPFMITIQGARYLEGESIYWNETATFLVQDADNPPAHLRNPRRLQGGGTKTTTRATGVRTLGVIRVCTRERSGGTKCPTHSSAALHEGIFGAHGLANNGVTVQSQFRRCSGGKLRWIPNRHGVKEVVLPNPASTYNSTYNRQTMETAVQNLLKAELKLVSVSEYADNTMFIMPPGMGFTAAAPANHWRSSYSDLWGTSLVGSMHEIGHNFQLGHAYEDNVEYGGKKGNMGSGGTLSGAPAKCFNAANFDLIGWFKDRSVSYSVNDIKQATKLTKLVAFVDYTKAAPNEPVNVELFGKYYLQYNRQEKHNRGTQAHGDRRWRKTPPHGG